MSNTKKHQKWCKKTLDVIVFTNNGDLSEALKKCSQSIIGAMYQNMSLMIFP